MSEGASSADQNIPAAGKFQEYQTRQIAIEDTLGNQYKTLNELWQKELSVEYAAKEKEDPTLKENYTGARVGGRDHWYAKQNEYWNAKPATIDGVTGGYGAHHEAEAEFSKQVFAKFKD